MTTHLQFESRDDFRAWLSASPKQHEGVWLLFGKPGGPSTLTASEALEEAICFGWIDGQMKSIDSGSYIKYFAPRRKGSKWSEKNKRLVPVLEERGMMTDRGRAAVAEAKANGQWDAPKAGAVTDEQVEAVAELLKGSEPAASNFAAMSPSVRKTYTRGYFAAKTDAGRSKRLKWMTDRLNQNLKPM